MRIGISLLCASRSRTGTDNVVFNLIRSLRDVDRKHEYVIFTNNYSREWFSFVPDGFNFVHVKLTAPRVVWLWEHMFFHLDSRRSGMDVVHFPKARGVIGFRGHNVLTVHDLNAYLGLHDVQKRQEFLYKAWYKANISKASLIVTVSEFTKNQIVENFPVPPEKVRVVYNGVDERFEPMPKSDAFIEKYGLPKRYILFVGSGYGNKNLLRLIEAYDIARNESELEHHLIIAGGGGDATAKIAGFVENRKLHDFVHFTGYFPDEALPKLYNHADLFIFPTLSEGFGIPPLEAMACGVPVVASDIPVTREVLGDAAVLVDPYSVPCIAEGISTALVDESHRRELVRKGFERAKMFSWTKAAREMVEVYEDAVGHKSEPIAINV